MPLENKANSQNISLRSGKYLNKIKTNLKLGMNYNIHEGVRIINSQYSSISNSSFSIDFNANSDIFSWLTADFNSEISWVVLETADIAVSKFLNSNYFLNLYFFTNDHQYFYLNSELYHTEYGEDINTNKFINFGYNYTFKGNSLEIRASINNVLNTEVYNTIQSNNYSIVSSNYVLRPRQLLISCNFSF